MHGRRSEELESLLGATPHEFGFCLTVEPSATFSVYRLPS
jgi:hypothetical protein